MKRIFFGFAEVGDSDFFCPNAEEDRNKMRPRRREVFLEIIAKW